MIKVSGQVSLRVNYTVELDMTEEEFDALTESKQNALIDESIDWHSTLRSAETDEVEVWDIEEV